MASKKLKKQWRGSTLYAELLPQLAAAYNHHRLELNPLTNQVCDALAYRARRGLNSTNAYFSNEIRFTNVEVNRSEHTAEELREGLIKFKITYQLYDGHTWSHMANTVGGPQTIMIAVSRDEADHFEAARNRAIFNIRF